MFKNNGPFAESKNNPSPYMNWFARDSQELKRGGTAPIMASRKNRNPVSSEIISNADIADQDGLNVEGSKNIPIITTSYGNTKGQTPVKLLQNQNNDGHKITKIVTNSGMNAYRLTKKASIDETNKPTIFTRNEMGNQANEVPVSPSQRFDKMRVSGSGQPEESLRDIVGASANFTGFGGSQNIALNRPQTSHYKGNGAFRRGRILNESSQNFEEYQTVNTGNLDLESLHNLNKNPSPDKNQSTNQRDYKSRQNITAKDDNEQRFPQDSNFENEFAENYPVKQSYEAKYSQETEPKYKGGKIGFPKRGDTNREKGDEAKITRLFQADGRYNKAKQIMEGRRYAEDVQTLDIDDHDEFSKKDTTNPIAKDQEKKADGSQNDFVSMIGRFCRDNNSKRNEQIDDASPTKGSPHRFTLDYGDGLQDVDNGMPQQTPGQRPPARKNGQAMNLNERSNAQSEKKPAVVAPTQIQQAAANVRPPSRQKIPTRALGLDSLDDDMKSRPDDIKNFAGEEISHRREQNMRKNSFQQNDDFGADFDNNNFETANFNKGIDLSDFLDAEEQNADLRRPNTSFANQRNNLQSAQGTRLRETNKHGPLQSAKPKQTTDAIFWGHSFQSNKVDPFDKLKGNRAQKDAKAENPYNSNKSSKAKPQTKTSNDLEGFDVLNFESDSGEDFEESLKKRRSMLQSAKPALGGNTSKNNFLTGKQGTYKDKKSNILFIYNKESHATKKDNIDLPFETTLEKDFVGLFAN